VAYAEAYRPLVPARRSEGAPRALAEDARRAVVGEAARRVEPLKLVMTQPPLLRTTDLAWVLERAAASPSDSERASWFAAASATIAEGFSRQLEAVDSQSPEAKQFRESLRRNRRPVEAAHPPISTRVDQLLDECASESARWIVLARVLFGDDRGYPDDEQFDHESRLWSKLDGEQRERARTAARRFLREHDDDREQWLTSAVFPLKALAGVRALCLLRATATVPNERPTDSDLERWLGAIVVARGRAHEGRTPGLLVDAHAALPAQFRNVVAVRARAEASSETGDVFAFDGLASIWSNDFDSIAVETFAVARTPQAIRQILDAMCDGHSRAVVASGFALVERGLQDDAPELDVARAAEACGVLLRRRTRDAWSPIWSRARGRIDFFRRVLSDVVGFDARDARALVRALSSQEIEELYLWLGDAPAGATAKSADDTPDRAWRETLSVLPHELLDALQTSGTSEAMQALERIASASNHEWMPLVLERARTSLLERSWRPIALPQLKSLLVDHRNRRVDSDAQLLDVVCEVLREIELDFRGTPAMLQFLYNDEKSGGAHKDEATLADFLKVRLDDALSSRGIVVNREVEIRRRVGADSGENPDLLITAVDRASGHLWSVPIEVKGDWNDEVTTAIETQLANRYVDAGRLTCGLYVVGYFGARPRRRFEELREALDRDAARLSARRTIRSIVLDCRKQLHVKPTDR
jgi:hypothetical protein